MPAGRGGVRGAAPASKPCLGNLVGFPQGRSPGSCPCVGRGVEGPRPRQAPAGPRRPVGRAAASRWSPPQLVARTELLIAFLYLRRPRLLLPAFVCSVLLALRVLLGGGSPPQIDVQMVPGWPQHAKGLARGWEEDDEWDRPLWMKWSGREVDAVNSELTEC